MWKKSLYFVCFTLLITVLAACSNEEDTADTQTGGSLVTISGSTSVGPLAEKLAMKYQEAKRREN